MKLKGLNTESEQDVVMLDSMYTGSDVDEYGAINIAEIKDEKSLEQVKKLSKRYKQLQAYVDKYGVKDLYKLENINGSAFVRGGMGFHNISVNDTRENLIERIKSIKEHGLLAAEWFGKRYHKNEAPFCVSFHKITEDSFVENLQVDKQQGARNYNTFPSGNNIAFFVDIENEALYPLLNPSDILDDINLKAFGYRFYDEKTVAKRLEHKIKAIKGRIDSFNTQLNIINTQGLETSNQTISLVISAIGSKEEKELLAQAKQNTTKSNELYSEIISTMDTILKNSTNPDHQALYAKLLASQNTGNTIYGDLFKNYAQDFPEQAKLWQEKINLQEQSQKIFRQLCLRIMDAPESEIESWRKQIYDKKYNEIVSTFNQDNESIWDYVNNHVYHVFSGVPSAFINGIALPKSLASDKEFVEQISTIFPKVMIFDREGEVIKDYPKELKQETSIEKGK